MSTQPKEISGVRLDRWLFAVRIFKTRSLAAKAIAGGKIKLNGENPKAHRLVQVGDEVILKREGRTHAYKVTGLIEKRVGAKDAVTNFDLTVDADLAPEMREMVQLYRQMDKQASQRRGRPTKRERRQIDKFRDHE